MGCMLCVQCRPFETNSVLTRASFFFASFTLTLYSLFLNPEKVSSRNSVLLADTKKATKYVFYIVLLY